MGCTEREAALEKSRERLMEQHKPQGHLAAGNNGVRRALGSDRVHAG